MDRFAKRLNNFSCVHLFLSTMLWFKLSPATQRGLASVAQQRSMPAIARSLRQAVLFVIAACYWNHRLVRLQELLNLEENSAFVRYGMLANLGESYRQCFVQSRQHGGFSGLRPPPKQIFKPPQIETWKTINQWSFCQFLECQDHPPHKRKGPLLKTFWRRFWLC